MVKLLQESVINLLTPTQCCICNYEGEVLCSACFHTTIYDIDSRCYKCNKLTKQHKICSSCRSGSSLRRVWWIGNYAKTLKELIHAMKYGRKRQHARMFGEYLAAALPYLPPDTVVLPIPTASQRIRQRGFDQARLIGEALAKVLSLELIRPLIRTTQIDLVGKNRQQRHQYMAQSFRLKPSADISGASILLVDDVLTTGATLEAAAKLLRQHGASHVDAAVVARHLLS